RHIPNAKVTLRIDAAKPVVLYVGRLSREKGIETLFEAVNLASEDIPSIELHLVGDGPLRQQLAQVARHYRMEHRTVFHGWVDQPNLPVYYSAADVTVMPSLSEPFGRVAVEAMACGSPMICTTVSGAADHIHEGETGFVVPPGDASELAVKLKRILQDSNLASRVGRQGREYVQRELSWEAVVRSMRLEVYQVLVPGQRT
ncbi:MAG: glycosyltransferase family 4 protein, partial [Chloroflexi bacterium]|nr:glycosyltransferase family 4 protein [Chloroflexota bacterium]